MTIENMVQVEGLELLSAADCARMCHISKRQWFRLNSSGKIPAPVRIGGSVRWRQSDIEHWLDLCCPDRQTFETVKGSQK